MSLGWATSLTSAIVRVDSPCRHEFELACRRPAAAALAADDELLAAPKIDGEPAAVEEARRRLVDCDLRLTRYRAALDNGADPSTVAGWVRDVQAEREAAERVVNERRAPVMHLKPTDEV
jgi:hypothetical protein